MALQPARLLLVSTPDWGSAGTGITTNAAGESVGIVGNVRIAGGGSKTISAAGGGKILWAAGAVTFASAGSKFRVGIQDVSAANGLEDGTYDVYKEYVQGTHTITASSYNLAVMDTGTKTLSDGDLIAIVAESTAISGADSINVGNTTVGVTLNVSAFGFPYGTFDTASLQKSTSQELYAVIRFDDGTTGWILGAQLMRSTATTAISFNSGSTPDEYCATFNVPFKMQISGVSVQASSIATADAFEVILYTDPYGTPVATVTLAPDQDIVGGTGTNGMHVYHITPTTLSPGVTYGVALRPTTTNNIAIYYFDAVTAANADIIKGGLPIPNTKFAYRTNQTGAFTVFGDEAIPILVLDVCGLDDGVSSSLFIPVE